MISECPVNLFITDFVETEKEEKIMNNVKIKSTQSLICLHYRISYMLVKLCTNGSCLKTKKYVCYICSDKNMQRIKSKEWISASNKCNTMLLPIQFS